MSLPQSDILLLNVIKQGIADLRRYPFFIDYIFEYTEIALVEKTYGKRELERAKKWFLTNDIQVGFEYSFDQARYPSIVITNASSLENDSMSSFADDDMASEEYINEANIIEQPRYIVGPITVSYDLTTGIVTLPNDFVVYPLISVGQSLVSEKSHNAYRINEILSESQFRIDAQVRDDFTSSYIKPQFNKLKVVRNRAEFKEVYDLECRVSGETASIIWLHTILLYILLKNRPLLEQNTFSKSSLTSGDIIKETDEVHGQNMIYRRTISLVTNVESRWVQSLSEIYESVTSGINLVQINDPTKTIYATIEQS